jgi:hypothetical protein
MKKDWKKEKKQKLFLYKSKRVCVVDQVTRKSGDRISGYQSIRKKMEKRYLHRVF